MSENILMSKIMKEEKKECNKKLRKDGITTTLSSMEVSLRKKPDTMIISKLIMKLKMKMNKLNKNQMKFRFYKDLITTPKTMISKRLILIILKMINLHYQKKNYSDSDIELLKMELLNTLLDKRGWLKDKLIEWFQMRITREYLLNFNKPMILKTTQPN